MPRRSRASRSERAARGKPARVAVHAREEPAAAVDVVEGAAVERVAPHTFTRRVHHEKVAGHTDSVHRHTDPAPDLHRHDRKRDGDADASFEHRVEERVLRIAVVVRVAPEAERLEETGAHSVERRGRTPLRELVEPRALAVDIETRMRMRGQTERGDVETHLPGRCGDRRRKPFRGVHDAATVPVHSPQWRRTLRARHGFTRPSR